jgi:hypothetical protein
MTAPRSLRWRLQNLVGWAIVVVWIALALGYFVLHTLGDFAAARYMFDN